MISCDTAPVLRALISPVLPALNRLGCAPDFLPPHDILNLICRRVVHVPLRNGPSLRVIRLS